MAYRRLPNTDNARLTAVVKLNSMLSKDKSELERFKMDVISFQRKYEELINQRDKYKAEKSLLNKQKKELLSRLKIYVSHFFQVFNFAIDRREINKEARTYFKLRTNTGVIPSLSKESEVIDWAYNIIVGENKRIKEGGEAISHPKVSKIRRIAEETECVINEISILNKHYDDYKVVVNSQRTEIDLFIKQMWNEIEFQFRDNPIEIKRKKATQYGVVYVK